MVLQCQRICNGPLDEGNSPENRVLHSSLSRYRREKVLSTMDLCPGTRLTFTVGGSTTKNHLPLSMYIRCMYIDRRYSGDFLYHNRLFIYHSRKRLRYFYLPPCLEPRQYFSRDRHQPVMLILTNISSNSYRTNSK